MFSDVQDLNDSLIFIPGGWVTFWRRVVQEVTNNGFPND